MINFLTIALLQFSTLVGQPTAQIGNGGWGGDIAPATTTTIATIGNGGWGGDIAAIGNGGWGGDIASIGNGGWGGDIV